MDFKKGFKIKPQTVLPTGEVIFTDGSTEVVPNQITCESYGYKYDRKNGVCIAFPYNTNVDKINKKQQILTKGSNNTAELGTENSLIVGQSNKTKGINKNVILSGNNNQINNSLDNTSIIAGSFGLALHNGEVVIGAGKLDDGELGSQQMSIIQLSGNTTNDTLTNLTIQNDGSHIEIQNNCILGFEAHLIGLCTGGTDGTAGQYIYYKLVGACKIDNGFNLTFTQSISTIADGSLALEVTPSFASVIDNFITLKVTGLAGNNINWYSSVHLYTNRTLNTF
jgi:hypothetical protein